eukprot:c38477_g1_i1 orf=2-187(+)
MPTEKMALQKSKSLFGQSHAACEKIVCAIRLHSHWSAAKGRKGDGQVRIMTCLPAIGKLHT